MARFALESKATLMSEQENKFKDSEASITSLQVYVLCSFASKLLFFHCFSTDFEGKKVKSQNWDKYN